MILFKGETKENKSWSTIIDEDADDLILTAVDSYTGKRIADLIRFESCGRVYRCKSAKSALISDHYDPDQHLNHWDKEGRLIIN